MAHVLRILGTRGVPAIHGGFETFAERLSIQLVQCGWRVIVYCQEEGIGKEILDTWQGVERVRIPVVGSGAWGSIKFDWKSIAHAAQHRDLCLTLGYNTAIFCSVLRIKGIPNIINMDGIEWSRSKWGPVAKVWLWLNERAACRLGNHLIADHPAIKEHLSLHVSPSKITTIAYGADLLADLPETRVRALGLEPGMYMTLIARPEPENSVLEVVEGFSRRLRGISLAVLGKYDDSTAFHRAVKAAAGPEVVFLGPIYEKSVIQALRFHCQAYVHGHQVGGTNPSLIEALGAGNAVIAHDNRFNRGVAGDNATYFKDADSLDQALRSLDVTNDLKKMAAASIEIFRENYTWSIIFENYERLLRKYIEVG